MIEKYKNSDIYIAKIYDEKTPKDRLPKEYKKNYKETNLYAQIIEDLKSTTKDYDFYIGYAWDTSEKEKYEIGNGYLDRKDFNLCSDTLGVTIKYPQGGNTATHMKCFQFKMNLPDKDFESLIINACDFLDKKRGI